MGNEKSRLAKKNRSASVDIAAKNVNSSNIQSSILDTSVVIAEKEKQKRETLPDNFQIRSFVRQQEDPGRDEIRASLNFVHEMILNHEIYMINSSMVSLSGMTADISKASSEPSHKKEITFQGNYFTENSLSATMWEKEKEPQYSKPQPSSIEPDIIIQFGNIIQNRVSQTQKNKSLEIEDDSNLNYKNVVAPVLQETPIFSDKKPSENEDFPQRLSPKFIISPGDEEKKNSGAQEEKKNSGRQERLSQDSHSRKSSEGNIRVPRDRVTFGFRDNSSAEVNTFEIVQEAPQNSSRASFQPFLEQNEIPNKPPYEFSKLGDHLFGKPITKVAEILPDRTSFTRTASEKTFAGVNNKGTIPSNFNNRSEQVSRKDNSNKDFVRGEGPIVKHSLEEKKQFLEKNKNLLEKQGKVEKNNKSTGNFQSLADFSNSSKAAGGKAFGNFPATKPDFGGKKPTHSLTARDKSGGAPGVKAEEENVIKVTLHAKRKSNQFSRDSKQSSISSIKDVKEGKDVKDVRITSMKINYDDGLGNKPDSKTGKSKNFTDDYDKGKKDPKSQTNRNKSQVTNKSALDYEGRANPALESSAGKKEKREIKARSVSPFTPPKKTLDSSQMNISSIKINNDNSFHKESLDDIRKSLESSSEKKREKVFQNQFDVIANKNKDLNNSPIYTSDEEDSEANDSRVQNNLYDPIFHESEKDEEEPLHLKISLDVGKYKKNNLASKQPEIRPVDKEKIFRESAEAEKLLKSVKEDIEKLTQKMTSQNYFSNSDMAEEFENVPKKEDAAESNAQFGDFRKMRNNSQTGLKKNPVK